MSSEPELVLAVHAGAGRIDPDASRRQAQTEGLRRSLEVGRELLVAGGSALDVVERAVRELEDCAEFNAGRGSVLTAEGSIEMDAAIASGSGRAGGVAALRRVRAESSSAPSLPSRRSIGAGSWRQRGSLVE